MPGSSITTDVNVGHVRIRGVEAALSVKPLHRPLSGYLNLAVSHAYGRGPVTGGFFPADPTDVPGGSFDLDHDQRVSAVANAVYATKGSYLSLTGSYGSRLPNGADIMRSVGLGLFDLNRSIHVSPSFVLDGSAGTTFVWGSAVVSPEIYLNNIFDNHYLLKGAFFSGASVGRPRSVELRVSVGY